MKLGALLWSPSLYCPSSPSLASLSSALPLSKCRTRRRRLSVFAAVESTEATQEQSLSARERRRLRNERRETKTTTNWREQVQERLSKKPKKQYTTLKAQRNLDHLAKLGPQWWIIRVSGLKREETVDYLSLSIAKQFPDLDFNIYAPAVQVKTRLKNDSYSVKPKPLFPGCIFLRCVLNKELHDFIREHERVGGFVAYKVGARKGLIKKPRPVSDMETIFLRAKEEQEKADQAFEEEEKEMMDIGVTDNNSKSDSDTAESLVEAKPERQLKMSSDRHSSRSYRGKYQKLYTPGCFVRIISGNFAGFEGSLKKLNRKTKKATVVLTLLGKESLVDIDISEVIPVTD